MNVATAALSGVLAFFVVGLVGLLGLAWRRLRFATRESTQLRGELKALQGRVGKISKLKNQVNFIVKSHALFDFFNLSSNFSLLHFMIII